MTESPELPSEIGPYVLKNKLEAGWGWVLYAAEQERADFSIRRVRLRIFFNQPAHGRLQKGLEEAAEKTCSQPHLHLQRIFDVRHHELENRHTLLLVAEEWVEPWTPPKKSDFRVLMGQLLAAMEHMAAIGLSGIGLSGQCLGRTVKGNAVLCNLSVIWDQQWAGRSRSGDAGSYAHIPPELAETPSAFEGPQWVWSAGILLMEAMGGMKNVPDSVADEIDVFDSAVSGYLSHQLAIEHEVQIQSLPQEHQEILRVCLKDDPKERYPDLASLRADIDVPVQTPGTAKLKLPTRSDIREVASAPQRPAIAAYAVAILILVLGSSFLFWHVMVRDRNADRPSLELRPDAVIVASEAVEGEPPGMDMEAAEEEAMPDPEKPAYSEPEPPENPVVPAARKTETSAEPTPEEVPLALAPAPPEAVEPGPVDPEPELTDETSGPEEPSAQDAEPVPEEPALAIVLLRSVEGLENLSVVYGPEDEPADQPAESGMKVEPGIYQFRFSRPDYYTMRSVVRFPYAPGRFAVTPPLPERWVARPALKQLIAWETQAQEEPLKVLRLIQAQSESLEFESEEHQQRLAELRQRLETLAEQSDIAVQLEASDFIPPVTLVISLKPDSTRTLQPGETLELSPGEYPVQFLRPDYKPITETLNIQLRPEPYRLRIPGEEQWKPEQRLLDLQALKRAIEEGGNSRTTVFLLQGLREQDFDYPPHRQQYLNVRKSYYREAVGR